MTIHVKYFASLRDRLGRGGDSLDLDDAAAAVNVADIWQRLWPDTPLPPNILTAVNQEYVELDHTVKDGDEVAFFPPVTGG